MMCIERLHCNYIATLMILSLDRGGSPFVIVLTCLSEESLHCNV